MQVGVDVICMHTNLDGRGLSGFRDFAHFSSVGRLKAQLHFHGMNYKISCHVGATIVHHYALALSCLTIKYMYLLVLVL